MTQTTDAERSALIVSAKESFRAAQRLRTWEHRVAAMARMNLANKTTNRKLLSGEGMFRDCLEKKSL
jgi:hypothetical protein